MVGRLSPLSWRQGDLDLWAKGLLPPEPRPGAPRLRPACTSAPRSLSHSKSPVPSIKLLPLAKEEK